MNIVFILVFKPHTHKVYILRHCTTIVYTTKDYLPENVTFMFTLEYMVRLNIADKEPGTALPFGSTWVQPTFLVASMLVFILVFCIVFVFVLCLVYSMLPGSLPFTST